MKKGSKIRSRRLLRDPLAVVPHLEDDAPPVVRRGASRRARARALVAAGRLGGVHHEVQHDLLELRGVARDGGRAVVEVAARPRRSSASACARRGRRVVAHDRVQVGRRALGLASAARRRAGRRRCGPAGRSARPPARGSSRNSATRPCGMPSSFRIRCISIEKLRTPESGLLISCATLAASWPSEARRSAWSSVGCAWRSCSVRSSHLGLELLVPRG